MSEKMIQITQNDYGESIEFDFLNSDKTPFNLTGLYVNLDIIAPDNTISNKVAQITDVINGKAEYILNSTDTSQIGLYTIYAYITDEDNKVTAQTTLYYYVIAIHGGVV